MNHIKSLILAVCLAFNSACSSVHMLEDEYKTYQWLITEDIPIEVMKLFLEKGKSGKNTIWYFSPGLGYRSYNYYSLKDECGTLDTLYRFKENKWELSKQTVSIC